MKAWPSLVFVVSMLLLAGAYPAFAQDQATIVIKDYQGVNPLPGAKLVIADSASPEDKREFTADGGGVVTVTGIDPSVEYLVEVYWRSSDYGGEEILVFQRRIQGSVLQEVSEIRVHVFNVEIKPTDKEGGGLDWLISMEVEKPAAVILNDVDITVSPSPLLGRAELIPQGEYRLKVIWDGYTVYDSPIKIGLDDLSGYIPGLDDEEKYQEELWRVSKIAVQAEVAELKIKLLDPEGNPLPGPVTITDPKGIIKQEFSFLTWKFFKLGLEEIGWPDLPIVEYKVEALWPFNKEEVLATATCTPGQLCEIKISPDKGPFYMVRVKVVTQYGAPLTGATVMMIYDDVPQGNFEETGEDGVAPYYLVRPGTYTLRVFIGKECLLERKIEVTHSEEVEITVEAKPVNVRIALLTADSKPYEVYWSLESSEGMRYDSGGRPSSTIRIENLQPGIYELKVTIPEYGLEYKFGPFTSEQLAGMQHITLPIADTRIRLRTPDGRPAVGCLIRVCLEEANICFENRTDENGEALFVNLPQNKFYNFTVFSGGLPWISWGEEITSTVLNIPLPGEPEPTPSAPSTPSATATITHTVTAIKEVTVTATETITQTATREVTNTVTKTTTETKIIEREVLPALPISIAIVVAAAIIAVAITLTRLKKTPS